MLRNGGHQANGQSDLVKMVGIFTNGKAILASCPYKSVARSIAKPATCSLYGTIVESIRLMIGRTMDASEMGTANVKMRWKIWLVDF